MRTTPVLILLVLAVLTAGCANLEVETFSDSLLAKELSNSNKTPLSYRMAIAPVHVSFNPEKLNQVEVGSKTWAHLPDAQKFQRELKGLLDRYPVTKDLVSLPGVSGNHKKNLTEAWNRESDILLTFNFKKWDTTYEGINWMYYPNLLQYANFIALSWFVPDEDYGVEAEVAVTAWATGSEKKLLTKTLTSKSIVKSLNDFQRGWQLAGILRIPNSLDVHNWEKIESNIGPFAHYELKKEGMSWLHNNLYQEINANRTVQKRLQKDLAVVIDIGKFIDELIPGSPNPKVDGDGVISLLTRRAQADIPKKNIVRLSGFSATRTRIRSTLQDVFSRSKSIDRCVVYFSGVSVLFKNGKAYLLPYDAELKQVTKSAVPLEDVLKLLSSISAKDIFLVLETSFEGSGAEAFGKRLEKWTKTPGRTVILATQPGKSVYEVPAKRVQSAFSYYLIEGAEQANVQTIVEAFKYAQTKVREWARRKGVDQTPFMYGTPNEEWTIRK